MQKFPLLVMMSLLTLAGLAQDAEQAENTLLWKISGNGLEKPSYLYGTIHMICKDDAGLSDNLRKVIREADEVYFEVDLDNMFEMLGAVSKFKMRGDTTLRDLLTETEYEKVKAYFEQHGSMLPFTMLESYKPILAASLLEQSKMPCESTSAMETEIMGYAKEFDKKIKGLETMGYQAGVLDQIPYKMQADQLVKYVETTGTADSSADETQAMMDAYRAQDLGRLEELITQSDPAISNYTEILLFQRNRNWVEKMKDFMKEKSLLFAVGAGHLPGKEGVIDLLRKMGYQVSPVSNTKSQSL